MLGTLKLFATAAAVTCHLAIIYDLLQDITSKCQHYAGIEGEPQLKYVSIFDGGLCLLANFKCVKAACVLILAKPLSHIMSESQKFSPSKVLSFTECSYRDILREEPRL